MITEPANLNILAPIPVTNPSFLYSKAVLIIAWAKPVIGIIRPHFANFTHLSKKPKAVNKQPKNITLNSSTKVVEPFSLEDKSKQKSNKNQSELLKNGNRYRRL